MRNLLIFMAFVAIFMFGWRYKGCINGVKGTGPVVQETRPLEPIHGVSVGGGAEMTIVRSEVSQITIETQQNVLDRIKTEVRNGILHIALDGFVTNADIRYRVEMPELSALNLSGAVQVRVETPFEGLDAEFSMSGGSSLKTSGMSYRSVNMEMSGGSQSTLSGSAERLDADLSGGTQLHAFDLMTKQGKVDLSGGALMECFPSEALEADISGGARVEYKGSPSVTQHVSGGGVIIAVDPG
ncbi:MAG: head GIN domain-containing protein [Saprospiraceae bacterium]